MARPSPTMNVMRRAVEKAARGLVRDFGEVEQLQVSRKGPANFVSVADTKAERTLKEELGRARPGWSFLMEESGETQGSDPDNRWIVDPLDGTTNFLHGIPHFSVAVAHEHRGEIVAGVIYDPIKDEMFWGEKGGGAYMNENRLRVSGRRQIEDAVVATGIPHRGRGDHAAYLPQLAATMEAVAGVRRMGSATLDLAYVAAGRYDGYWENWLSPWDIAAGVILVREAGGTVTDMAGGARMLELGSVLAGNPQLHGAIGDLLRGSR